MHVIRNTRRMLALLTALAAVTALLLAPTSAGVAEAKPKCPEGGTVRARDLDRETKKKDCDLTGRIIEDEGGPGAVVPRPGTAVYADMLFPEGPQEFVIETLDDGTVVLDEVGLETHEIEAASAGVASANPDDACDQSAYTTSGHRWTRTLSWYFKGSTHPPNTVLENVAIDLANGYNNFPTARNPCGRADNISATHSYRGGTDKASYIDSAGRCALDDTYSVVDFGNLGSTAGGTPLAVNCTYRSSGVASSSDIKFERLAFNWFTNGIPSGCSGKYSIEAVMTHETGHSWGLGHVSESTYPHMTMSTHLGPCDRRAVSLGLGDLLGMESLY